MTKDQPERFKSKLIFCWMALLFGFCGAQWLYMQRGKRFFWNALFTPLCAFAGWAECIRYGLMTDEQFNARFNPHAASNTPQGSGAVVLAIALSLAFGMTALMATMALVFQYYLVGSVA